MLLDTDCAIAVKTSSLGHAQWVPKCLEKGAASPKKPLRSEGHNSRCNSGLALLEESVLVNACPLEEANFQLLLRLWSIAKATGAVNVYFLQNNGWLHSIQ